MSQRITAWLPHGGNIDSQYGTVSHLEWLRQERARFASKGKLTHIRTAEAGVHGRGYPTAALFLGNAEAT